MTCWQGTAMVDVELISPEDAHRIAMHVLEQVERVKVQERVTGLRMAATAYITFADGDAWEIVVSRRLADTERKSNATIYRT